MTTNYLQVTFTGNMANKIDELDSQDFWIVSVSLRASGSTQGIELLRVRVHTINSIHSVHLEIRTS